AVGEADARHELFLLRFIELEGRADVRNQRRQSVGQRREAQTPPQPLHVNGRLVVFPSQTQIERQFPRGLPIRQAVDRESILTYVGYRQAFWRGSIRRVSEQKRREASSSEITVEIQSAARNVGRATEERGAAKIEAKLHVVRALGPGNVVVDLMQVVEIVSVAAVLF